MTFASLRALHALIGAAIDDMERVYHERSPDLDYPSIDKPYYKADQHTLEEELAETNVRPSCGCRGEADCGGLRAPESHREQALVRAHGRRSSGMHRDTWTLLLLASHSNTL